MRADPLELLSKAPLGPSGPSRPNFNLSYCHIYDDDELKRGMAITINASNRLLLLVEIKEILLMKMAVLFLILRTTEN
jgi:hypothetical protein